MQQTMTSLLFLFYLFLYLTSKNGEDVVSVIEHYTKLEKEIISHKNIIENDLLIE
jgi:hypothetical protein